MEKTPQIQNFQQPAMQGPQQPAEFCKAHQKELTKICIDDRQPLCNECIQFHEGHVFSDPKDCVTQISQLISELDPQVLKLHKRVEKVKLVNAEPQIQKQIQEINGVQDKVIKLIMDYFNDVKEIYMRQLVHNFPCNQAKVMCGNSFEQTSQQFQMYKEKIEKNQLGIQDITNFMQGEYKEVVEDLEQKVKIFEDTERIPNEKQIESQFPAVRINDQGYDKIMAAVLELITPYSPYQVQPPADASKPKIEVAVPQQNQIKKFAVVDDQANMISTYNLQTKARENIPLKSAAGLISYQPTTLVLPNGKFYITGGIGPKQTIRGEAFEVDLNQKEVALAKLENMIVKRVGHSMIFVPNVKDFMQQQADCIYVVGGRIKDKTRTKLCERYNMRTKQWEKISKLHHARSRPALALFGQQHIYAFYGTDSYNKTMTCIEQYDIINNNWREIVVKSHLPGYDISYASALQINNSQILIFGGFRESAFKEKQIILNRKISCFNVHNNSVILFPDQIPVDLIPQQAAIIDKSIYTWGSFITENGVSENQLVIKQSLNSFNVLRISEQRAELVDVFQTPESKPPQK